MMGTTVKAERHDDAEINELARRIAEQNRAKLAQLDFDRTYCTITKQEIINAFQILKM